MQILGRIKLPKSDEVSNLYVQCNDTARLNYSKDAPEIVLRKGGLVSFNSYFNSFYENFYVKYTTLDSIYYLLKLEGDFQISVCREDAKHNKNTISSTSFRNCNCSHPIQLKLPDLARSEFLGRSYLEIECLSDRGLVQEGLIATEKEENREISLGIISCTFRKEAYIKNTINSILQDELLQKKDFKIFVVDNGNTLSTDDFEDPKVELIPNRNVGGSGGFTRGLMAALTENYYSHFLFMDDDIELDNECIFRLFSLYEYAKFDFAVAGSMLDLYKKHILYETGALYAKSPDDLAVEPFSVAPLKHKLDLKNPHSLNLLLSEEHIDYGGFWFFSFSRKLVEEIGLLMPFFIKVDDMEFGLRINKYSASGKIVGFPTIAVWHEPFYAKFPIWDTYYHFRNSLITHAIYGSLGYVNAIANITKGLIFALLTFDYNSAQLVIKAFEDYLQGPDLIKNNDPEILHLNAVRLSKSSKSQTIQQNYSSSDRDYDRSKPGSFKKLLSLLTLNGHLLPNFLTTDEDVFIWHGNGASGQRSKAFAKKRVLMFKEEGACLFQNEIDKMAGIKLLTRWFKVAVSSSIKWTSIKSAWKEAASEFVSTGFWQQFLELKR